MTEFYSTGTIAVEQGSVDFVGTGTAWLPVNAKKGDTLNVAGHVILIDEITDPTHGKFAIPYPGATASGLPYAVAKTSTEWGTNRTLALQTAEMIQLLTTVVVERTGIAFNAYGTEANRSAHDAAAGGFVYLSVDAPWTLWTKLSGTAADWSEGQEVRGGKGDKGDPGLIGEWRGAWEPGTYNELDVVEHNGSAYIVKVGVVSTTQEPPGSDWELVAAKGGQGDAGTNGVDGKFSGAEIIKTAAYTAVAADVGKTIILNKATPDTLSFAAAAALGATWMVFVKNVGAGTWTLDPNGAETIDGAATVTLEQGESLVVSSNGTALRIFFRGSAGLADGSVTNAKLANMAASTFKGRATAGVGVPEDLTAAQVLALLKVAGAYAKDNILGTVSQSAGVPTGAVIERGSNANGEYIRLADGTQICYRAWSQTVAATSPYAEAFLGFLTWDFPASFQTAPAVSQSAYMGGRVVSSAMGEPPMTTRASFYIIELDTANTGPCNVWAIAIGRWF